MGGFLRYGGRDGWRGGKARSGQTKRPPARGGRSARAGDALRALLDNELPTGGVHTRKCVTRNRLDGVRSQILDGPTMVLVPVTPAFRHCELNRTAATLGRNR